MIKVTFESAKQTVCFEYPETVTHRVLGEDYEINLDRVNEDGWRALLAKSRRFIADGSPDTDTVERKIDQLYGVGKPIGSRTTRDPAAGFFAKLVVKKLVKGGLKVKDVPKLGATVESVRVAAYAAGVSAKWLAKALKHAKAQADLAAAEIE